jgi:NodT family efflux transporter outer membrane factor (OMF) lipoprotein
MRTTTRILGAVILLVAAGCTVVGRDYETPESTLPAGWREATAAGIAPRAAELSEWWTQLHDPVLDGLVERAMQGGLDVREALARVREARALRGVSAADRWPTVDANASYVRQGESDNTPFGSFVPDSDLYTVGLDAAWELDLWGRVRRSVEAADADLEATIEDARDTLVTLAAETALSYVELRAFQQRLAIARQNVELQQSTLDIVRSRYDAGLVGERDVAQAATQVESTRSFVPAFETGLRAAENRLAVLLGLSPGALAAELAETRPIPVPPNDVAVGVPADLLRRRADVRRAERVLAAETARVGVAEGRSLSASVADRPDRSRFRRVVEPVRERERLLRHRSVDPLERVRRRPAARSRQGAGCARGARRKCAGSVRFCGRSRNPRTR